MKVYFAHPCFNDKQKKFKTEFLNRLSFLTNRSNIVIIDPFEHTPNVEDLPIGRQGDIETKLKKAESIKIECIRLLEECDIIVALVDGDDTGVAFEAGYAHALNKPLILISEKTSSTANAMLIGAARAMIDNVLDEEQMRRLVDTLLWYRATIEKYPGRIENN